MTSLSIAIADGLTVTRRNLIKVKRVPDLIGINHYVTSERWLDDRIERYPASTVGGNGTHRYADVEVVRALAQGGSGLERLLGEAWERYRLPMRMVRPHRCHLVSAKLHYLATARTRERSRQAGHSTATRSGPRRRPAP